MSESTMTLYRPVGARELALIAESGFRRFPPRLPEHPIFYPVCNEQYAIEIAQRWNAKQSGKGYVTRFCVRSDFLARYETHIVGARHHRGILDPGGRARRVQRGDGRYHRGCGEFSTEPTAKK